MRLSVSERQLLLRGALEALVTGSLSCLLLPGAGAAALSCSHAETLLGVLAGLTSLQNVLFFAPGPWVRDPSPTTLAVLKLPQLGAGAVALLRDKGPVRGWRLRG